MKRSCRIHRAMIWAAFLFWCASNAAAAPPLPPTKTLSAIKPVCAPSSSSVTPPQQSAPNPVLSPKPVLKTPVSKCPGLKFLTPEVLPAAQAEREYHYRLAGGGGAGGLVFVLADKEALPPGLSLAANGILAGRPFKAGNYALPVLLKDGCPGGPQQVGKKFFLKINPATRLLVTGAEDPEGQSPTRLNSNAPVASQPHPAERMLRQPATDSRDPTQPDLARRGSDKTKPERPPLKDSKFRPFSGVTSAPAAAPLAGNQDNAQTPHVQGQIVVTMQLEKGAQLVQLLQDKYKLSLLESFTVKALKQMVATFRTDRDLAVLIREIRMERGVVQAQKNQVYGTFAEPRSDLQNLCALLDFSKLHKYRRGKRIKVALIDTGVDLAHEDLKNRVVYSENFIKGSLYRAEAHGTAVAGIIAASINNFGIEGIAPEAELLALRACEQVSEKETLGKGYTTSIIRALDTAILKKARIVNMSFGSPAPDPIITSLIVEGSRQGILFVAPVGNRPGQEYPAFPASCPGVIAVGGLDQNGNPFPDDHLVSFARINAPAENIFTTLPGNKHNFMTGTSFSSAIVTGILALGLESNPGLNPDCMPEKNNNLCDFTEKLLKMKICLKTF